MYSICRQKKTPNTSFKQIEQQFEYDLIPIESIPWMANTSFDIGAIAHLPFPINFYCFLLGRRNNAFFFRSQFECMHRFLCIQIDLMQFANERSSSDKNTRQKLEIRDQIFRFLVCCCCCCWCVPQRNQNRFLHIRLQSDRHWAATKEIDRKKNKHTHTHSDQIRKMERKTWREKQTKRFSSFNWWMRIMCNMFTPFLLDEKLIFILLSEAIFFFDLRFCVCRLCYCGVVHCLSLSLIIVFFSFASKCNNNFKRPQIRNHSSGMENVLFIVSMSLLSAKTKITFTDSNISLAISSIDPNIFSEGETGWKREGKPWKRNAIISVHSFQFQLSSMDIYVWEECEMENRVNTRKKRGRTREEMWVDKNSEECKRKISFDI